MDEVVQYGSEFYQRFDFSGVTTKEDVWIFLKKGFVKNLYDEDDVVAGKNLLIGLPRCVHCGTKPGRFETSNHSFPHERGNE